MTDQAHSDRPGQPASTTCPTRSPESQTPCDLEDTFDAHWAGHQAKRSEHEWTSWATSAEDYERWNHVG